ncbi:MAG: ATP-dependent DNA helicase RecG, partial [Dehalococcoidia bacterium]|nr:ATP-dependent DNA helicase RecG [Dehalococcoidia bacterium]
NRALRWLDEMDGVQKKTTVREPEKIQVHSSPVLTPSKTKKALKPAAGVDKDSLDKPITKSRGVGDSLLNKFSRLGVNTVRDLFYYFPRRHLDYSQIIPISSLSPGDGQTIIANIWETRVVRLGTMKCTEAVVGDESGNIRVIWFNQPYLVKTFHTNEKIVLSGRVNRFKGWNQMESPEWEFLKEGDLIHTGRLVPIYPLTSGLYQRQVRRFVKGALDKWLFLTEDFIPPGILRTCKLPALPEAILQFHYPENLKVKNTSRERLAFDELFLLQLGVVKQKRNWQESQPGNAMALKNDILERFLTSLPFELTRAQNRVLQDILGDIQKGKPMSRLLQGEVGSGKTVVALAALVMAVANGFQTAIMAPTEVLVEQHFQSFIRLLSQAGFQPRISGNIAVLESPLEEPITIVLLKGSLPVKAKRELKGLIAEGKAHIVIGTHALIQEGVEFKRLGLVVIDEQHRFGVLQRSALRQKGFNPHILVMTATPIPRTLALTLYGDLDLSIIDEVPPGRQKISTKWVLPEKRQAAFEFLKQQIQSGRQAFVICPLIEESESIAAKAAVVEYTYLSRDVFPELRLGLLHGKMKSEKKEETMRHFRDGELDILVSTAVVEVGIDVPNATVMLVEGADRFGLSQLHQFRGRVGRGTEKSYCLLLAEEPSPQGRERLNLIEKIHDGFILAEEDLKLRGPGEFFGTRQAGMPDLRMAKLTDIAILETARREAEKLFEKDPGLKLPEHLPLRKEMARVWKEGGEWN